MEYKKEDMLDLCEESVKYLFNYCVATKDTADDYIAFANFVDSFPEKTVPDMKFDYERVKEKEKTINYLLGQLKNVHLGTMYMKIGDGFCKYDDTIWTKNKMILFTLYYLANVVLTVPKVKFTPTSKGLIAILYSSLQPTLSPHDPNFKG